jgi:hypothetical protein
MSNRTHAFALATLIGTLSGVAGAEPLAALDSEQRGAAAWVTTFFATNWTEGVAGVMVSDSVPFTQAVLAKLDAATTPAALRAMPSGITIPCANGGSYTVRMSRGLPRVLSIEWSDCQIVRWNPTQVLTGPGQVVLLGDTFTPTHVAAIWLGSSNRDLVMPSHEASPDQVSDSILTRNVRMIGVIPVSTAYVPEGSATSIYQASGVRHEVRELSFPASTRAPEHHEVHAELKNGVISETVNWADDFFYYDDEWRYVAGEFTQTQVDPFWGTQTTRWSVDNLRIRRITDYANWTGNFSYDGGFKWTWPAQAPAGCLSGSFAVRTRSPFTIPNLDANVQDSGELAINGAATYRAYSAATVPPGLPVPTASLLSMSVRNVGTFNYEIGQFPDQTRIASNCQ